VSAFFADAGSLNAAQIQQLQQALLLDLLGGRMFPSPLTTPYAAGGGAAAVGAPTMLANSNVTMSNGLDDGQPRKARARVRVGGSGERPPPVSNEMETKRDGESEVRNTAGRGAIWAPVSQLADS